MRARESAHNELATESAVRTWPLGRGCRATASATASASRKVILVRLHVKLHELGRDESHVVSLAAQSCADEVCSRAGFDANQRALQVGGVG